MVARILTRSTKGQSSREAVVLAAKRLFGTQGYPSTSIQQIADAVGRSQSAVMHYFPAKSDIFAAVIDEMITVADRIRADFTDPQASALDRLMYYFEVNYRWGVETEHHPQILTALLYFASFDETFKALYTALAQRSRARALELLHAGGREALFPVPADPLRTAELLHDAMTGLLVVVVASTSAAEAKASQSAKWRLAVRALTGHDRAAYF
jgi:AcrR family transcriptional regulator